MLTLLTLAPPMIPPDWARLEADGVYLPQRVEAVWPNYTVQVALWLGMVGGLLWGVKPSPYKLKARDQWFSVVGTHAVSLRIGILTPLVVVLLTLLGFGLRVYALQSLPLILDEIGFAAHASDILHGQHVPIFAPGHNANPSVYSWLLAGAMGVFGQNLFAIRLIPLFFGVLSISAAYRLGRTWYSPSVGLVAAAFLATFPAHLFYSRLSLYDIADPLFALLALACLRRAFTPAPHPPSYLTPRPPLQKREGEKTLLESPSPVWRGVWGEVSKQPYETPLQSPRLNLVLAGIFAACAQYFYHGARLLLVLMAVYILLELGWSRRKWRVALPGLARMSFAVILLTLPVFLPRLAHGLPLTGNINPLKLPPDLADNSLRALLAWVSQPDVSLFWLSDSPLLLWPALAATLAGIVLLRPRDARYWTLLLSLVLTTIFGGAILIAAPLYVRYLVALPALVLLVGVGVQSISDMIRRGIHLNAPTTRLLEIALVALICLHGIGVALGHPAEARTHITPSQWWEYILAQQAASLPPGTPVVLVVPPEFGEVQRITVAHMVTAFGERRALTVNLSQPARLPGQRRRLPGTAVIIKLE